MSRGYISDARNIRAPGSFSENEMVGWCLICFVMGAAGACVVLGVLAMGAA